MSRTDVAARPARVVVPPLQRMYVYEHCPFAARVRYGLGMKNVKHEVVWMMYDDHATPKGLVGIKIVPIFQAVGPCGVAVMESMDIVKAVDADPRYGPPGLFRPASGRTDIKDWFAALDVPIRRLVKPRASRAQLPEFCTRDGREAFERFHVMPDPKPYTENIAMSKGLIAEVQPKMQALDDLIFSPEYCTEGGLSLDDADLFPQLRALTFVKDLVIPEKMLAYVTHHSVVSEVSLLHAYAE